jgi:hypothetical protein
MLPEWQSLITRFSHSWLYKADFFQNISILWLSTRASGGNLVIKLFVFQNLANLGLLKNEILG